MDRTTLEIAMAAMSNRNSIAKDVAKKLNMTTTTLYYYVNSDGSLKERGLKVMNLEK